MSQKHTKNVDDTDACLQGKYDLTVTVPHTKHTTHRIVVRPAIRYGIRLPHYWVAANGELWQNTLEKRLELTVSPKALHQIMPDVAPRTWEKVSYIAHSGAEDQSLRYPMVSVKSTNRAVAGSSRHGWKTMRLHQIVAETFKPIPIPSGCSKSLWKQASKKFKDTLRCMWIVNHIDHNKMNFHPSNLEWVSSAKENAEKYQAHRKARLGIKTKKS